jgi:hypothetical protein
MIANSTYQAVKTPLKWPEAGKNGKWKKLHTDYPHIRVLRGFVGSGGVK